MSEDNNTCWKITEDGVNAHDRYACQGHDHDHIDLKELEKVFA